MRLRVRPRPTPGKSKRGAVMTAPLAANPTFTTARRKRVLKAERQALMNRLWWAQDARDRAEERILLISSEVERIDREIAGAVAESVS